MRLEEEFEGCHSDIDCPGAWEIVWKEKVPRYFDSCLVSVMPKAPFVVCEKCETSFYPEGFEDGIDEWLMILLVTDNRLLTKVQLKFLRLHLDLKPSDIAEFLGCSYKSIEDRNSDTALDPYTMMRLKIWYASKIGVPSGNWMKMVTKPDFNNEIEIPREVPQHIIDGIWRDCRALS